MSGLPGGRSRRANTVLRGGYGLFFDSAEGREIDGAADVYPYVSRGNYQQSLGQPTPLQTTDALFPSFEQPGVATPAANTFLAVSQSPEPKNPYVQQWSLGVQRQLTSATTLELNYIGNKGTNLLMRQNVAQALPYDPANPQPVDARRPFPNFVVYIDSNWGGRSNYNAFNTKLEHRGRASLLTFAYTWAKSTDTKSAAAGIGATRLQRLAGLPEQPRSRTRSRPVGLRRRPSAGRELRLQPAVRQRRALCRRRHGRQERDRRRLAGERHLHLAARLPDHDPGRGSRRIERHVRRQPRRSRRRSERIRQTASSSGSTPPPSRSRDFGQFGNTGRNILRGPGVNNLDFSLFKNFDFGTGMQLQFRFESFNFLNHPQFNRRRHQHSRIRLSGC